MDCTIDLLDYADTGYFSNLIVDFLRGDPKLEPFRAYGAGTPDFAHAMEQRRQHPVDRDLLVAELNDIYRSMPPAEPVQRNIALLGAAQTFTVCTAHQPNLFTGYLYFAYKILQVVKLAADLKARFPQADFVPVYWMGSEDNDLDELGTVQLGGKTLRWDTRQSGAVGRMATEDMAPLLDQAAERLGYGPYSGEVNAMLREAYLGHPDIQTATLSLVHALFGRYGVVTVIADRPAIKRAFLPVMREELFEQPSFPLVMKATGDLSAHYHAQATPREINLFYLDDQLRERIVRQGEFWTVLGTERRFDRDSLEAELESHPERFSPNVILRGLLQESILPNIAFVGGGGEIAYWLELKGVFAHFGVPFPPLLLRNSVLWIDEKQGRRLEKTGLQARDLFTDTDRLISAYVLRHSRQDLILSQEYRQVEALYDALSSKASAVDPTLKASVAAERQRALRAIGKLEHKFLRAEKKKFAWQTDRILALKQALFPGGSLQERVENLLPFYAAYGPGFLDAVYEALDPLNPGFTVIAEKPGAVRVMEKTM